MGKQRMGCCSKELKNHNPADEGLVWLLCSFVQDSKYLSCWILDDLKIKVMVFTQDLNMVQTKERGWDSFQWLNRYWVSDTVLCWEVWAPDSWLMDVQGVPCSMRTIKYKGRNCRFKCKNTVVTPRTNSWISLSVTGAGTASPKKGSIVRVVCTLCLHLC